MGLMDELKKIIHPYDDEDYDYEDDFEEPVKESSRSLFDDRKDDRREDRRSVFKDDIDNEIWCGIRAINDETPGFEVVLAEGDMRLYRIAV